MVVHYTTQQPGTYVPGMLRMITRNFREDLSKKRINRAYNLDNKGDNY